MFKKIKFTSLSNGKVSLILMAVLLLPAAMLAQDITGQQIIENVYNRSTGEDQEGNLTMSLINSRGEQRVREIRQFLKDYGEMEKKIMFFLAPADVRNTSFMNWSYEEEGKDDDQWIYLPALKKVKRISSDSKSDYFMGSDFTYDDLGDRHPKADKHKLLREENIDGELCLVVESIPKEEGYMYSKTITWVIKDKWIGKKKEFYDEDGDLLKILKVKEVKTIKDYFIITLSEMHNVQKDHTTRMYLQEVRLDIGIDDNNFTERMMKRGL
ncbi:MAG: outer membrane lipoprotein-sorting protein [Candidatus Cloacimonetes bacterium]|nr:outer membrane lipoprotein-sorting protein [Candidatus Cloacimonadota bacterium]MCF7813004.1 outer membrane lipoprotein-sorting protein [Candidatus Cloacimonadota bacterium]MCF7867264.1 outer membrane lipoprotein-sorting protein [Candidatus Cloacimonadota bacterium]MCF7882708.1 outer membrane lipoprotein-sorting protein [Candidatus Cloacimonadota bacterium]